MRALLAAALAALSALVVPAAAGTRSLMYSPGDMGAGAAFHLNLQASGFSTTFVHLMLPSDFKKDSAATLRLTFLNASINCSMRFGIDHVERMRAGQTPLSGSPAAMGVTGGNIVDVAVPPSTAFIKTYVIKGMTTGQVKGQRAGDVISVAFERQGDNALDTCSNLTVLGSELRYTTP